MLRTVVVAALFVLLGFAHAGTSPEGLKFLKKKKKEEGVVALPSGLLYKELRPGTGPTPKADTQCSCHYEGSLTNGKVFDSSYQRRNPVTFAPQHAIKGWREALQLMNEGALWELYIPSELAYGDRDAGIGIPGGAVSIYKMELLHVKLNGAADL